jgi:hypothetical protein
MLETVIPHYLSPFLASTVVLSTDTLERPLIEASVLNILSHTPISSKQSYKSHTYTTYNYL